MHDCLTCMIAYLLECTERLCALQMYQGEVATGHRIDVKKSYTSLHTLVNDMFPPTSLVEQVN